MMLSLTGYLLILATILGICGIASLLTPRYMRACPQCCLPLSTSAARCRSCGYRPQ
jgi:predicted amidophosphoribosyltransferase